MKSGSLLSSIRGDSGSQAFTCGPLGAAKLLSNTKHCENSALQEIYTEMLTDCAKKGDSIS